MAVPSKS